MHKSFTTFSSFLDSISSLSIRISNFQNRTFVSFESTQLSFKNMFKSINIFGKLLKFYSDSQKNVSFRKVVNWWMIDISGIFNSLGSFIDKKKVKFRKILLIFHRWLSNCIMSERYLLLNIIAKIFQYCSWFSFP